MRQGVGRSGTEQGYQRVRWPEERSAWVSQVISFSSVCLPSSFSCLLSLPSLYCSFSLPFNHFLLSLLSPILITLLSCNFCPLFPVYHLPCVQGRVNIAGLRLLSLNGLLYKVGPWLVPGNFAFETVSKQQVVLPIWVTKHLLPSGNLEVRQLQKVSMPK